MHKNHVHVFDKKKKKEVATINGLASNVTYQDLGLPTKLGEMITEYAYTAMKNVSKCMTMFYFHTFWTIRAFHFSYQRLR